MRGPPRPGKLPRLHVVTDSRVLDAGGFVERASGVLEAGGRALALHLRGPGTGGRALYRIATTLAEARAATGGLVLVNDRVDVAVAARLDGVHLGERSLPVKEARGLVGPAAVVGASVHDAARLRRAAGDGANYVLAGTIFSTASHPGRTGIGTRGLAEMIEAAPALPVLAIGGMDVARVPAVVEAGAWGVAVLSGIWDAPDPGTAVLDYLAALERASGPAGPTP